MKFVGRVLDLLDAQRGWSPLLLRVVVGATFIVHGYGKVFETGILETAKHFANIPLGTLLGPLVPIVEFFGGIFVIAGLGTRAWAFLQACTMAFAIAFVHFKQGYAMRGMGEHVGGWEWQALLLVACLVLVIQGAGALSFDALFRRRYFPRDHSGLDTKSAVL